MCGIAGFYKNINFSPEPTLLEMNAVMNHRGPDDSGIWYDRNENIGLSHTRLSILDLSSAASQPMCSDSGRYVISFNGEIYNHLKLRGELKKNTQINWKSTSDTETLIEMIEYYGLDLAIKKIHGMFALALWDKSKKVLSLVRDRMGEKPLYYGSVNGTWVFASELKAFKKLPNFRGDIDDDALSHFLSLGCIPSPLSIYKGIHKVEPGKIVTLDSNHDLPQIRAYWSTINEMLENYNTFTGSDDDAINTLEGVLKNAVKMQMISDVPTGAFLSGGIDSSLICALMQANSSKKIDTCSIGFDSEEFNEAEHARAVSEHLGTNHFDMYVSGKEALELIPNIPSIYDEPFADSSQIPTYLVSKIAKENVTVALTGDAGDELFGGYNRYTLTNQYWRKLSLIPKSLRDILGAIIKIIPPNQLNSIFTPILGSKYRNIGDKLHKGASVMGSIGIENLYGRMLSQITEPNDWLINQQELIPSMLIQGDEYSHISDIEKMMISDLIGYLPNDILVKVDRASMSVSLESRVPFLDHDVVRFAASLPLSMKIRGGDNKWILKKLLYKYIPEKLVNRPKMGFSVPLDDWLRGPLLDWTEALLDSSRLHNEGFFNVSMIRKKWGEHKSGLRNWQYQLWNVLMFQAWLDQKDKNHI